MKTLLVGGGITSSLIGFFLRNFKTKISLDLWEMEDELGGRMKTIKTPHSRVPVDLGAQYVTTNSSLLDCYKDVYDSLFQNRKLREMSCVVRNFKSSNDYTLHYVAPDGMSSLVRHFVSNNFLDVCPRHNVTSLNIYGNKILVETYTGVQREYDAVVLTIPVPNILKLAGNFRNFINANMYRNLTKVKYSSRFALVLVYDSELNVDWAAMYTPQDTIFRYVAIQEKKVGQKTNQSSVVFHTSVEFGEEHVQTDMEEVKSMLVTRVLELFPDWTSPVDVVCHRWEHSQVISSYPESPKCLVLSWKPLVMLAGDSFTRSNFDSCVASAKDVADILVGNR